MKINFCVAAIVATLILASCSNKPQPATSIGQSDCDKRVAIAKAAGVPPPPDCVGGQAAPVSPPVTLADIRQHQGKPPAPAAPPAPVGSPTDMVDIGGGVYCQRQTAGMRSYWTHVNSLPNESSIDASIKMHLKGVDSVVREKAAAVYAGNGGTVVYVQNKERYCSMTFGKGLHQENVISMWSNRTKLKAIKVEIRHEGYIWEFFYFPDASTTAPIEDQGCKNLAVRARKEK